MFVVSDFGHSIGTYEKVREMEMLDGLAAVENQIV